MEAEGCRLAGRKVRVPRHAAKHVVFARVLHDFGVPDVDNVAIVVEFDRPAGDCRDGGIVDRDHMVGRPGRCFFVVVENGRRPFVIEDGGAVDVGYEL